MTTCAVSLVLKILVSFYYILFFFSKMQKNIIFFLRIYYVHYIINVVIAEELEAEMKVFL
jgi:hypothetical protein